ncbi:uncharacterized protein E0L32_006922 [Thyridium curvatum]|uniref:Uncharacterized protein n=1 Tax=Thyridium curvatum TaxID=1093900 RepID=A0A507ANC4_9PEZI|nr:uncharacterized protein E0L32_006922 [Thyridium curvatum]TPX12275.1 hypothetical protein E0L32_006922 [Thyridium curvatum]
MPIFVVDATAMAARLPRNLPPNTRVEAIIIVTDRANMDRANMDDTIAVELLRGLFRALGAAINNGNNDNAPNQATPNAAPGGP